MVCFLDIIHAGVLFWASLHIHTDHVWNSQSFISHGHKYGVNYDPIYCICSTIFETQTGWYGDWTDGDYTIWPWPKWNIVDEYSIVSTMNSTENMYNILEQIVHSYQPMCSLVRKLCHNLQFKFEAQCATNWWHAFVCGWQICHWVIITQDVSSV